MDFALTEEQRMVRDMVREFADREMAPVIPALERQGIYPEKVVASLAELGILGMAIPEEFGGNAFDTVSIALVMEEIARVCASTAVTVGVHNAASAAPIARSILEHYFRLNAGGASGAAAASAGGVE